MFVRERQIYIKKPPKSSTKPPESFLLLLLVVSVLVTLASIVLARRPAADVFNSLDRAQTSTFR